VPDRAPNMLDIIFSSTGEPTNNEMTTAPLTEQEAILKYLKEQDKLDIFNG
jgi:hypothetical protein